MISNDGEMILSKVQQQAETTILHSLGQQKKHLSDGEFSMQVDYLPSKGMSPASYVRLLDYIVPNLATQ